MTALPVFRAPMRARELDLPQFDGARFGVGNGLVGIGETLDQVPAGESEAVLALSDRYGLKSGRMLDRFIDIPEGSFVWTQTGDAEFRLGHINGPWRYEDSVEARGVGIHHVRPTIWIKRPFGLDSTPAAVINTFNRGGKNFQRINDNDVELETAVCRQSTTD